MGSHHKRVKEFRIPPIGMKIKIRKMTEIMVRIPHPGGQLPHIVDPSYVQNENPPHS